MPTTRRTVSNDPLLAVVRGLRDQDARVQVATYLAVLDWSVCHVADPAEALALAEPTDVMAEPALHLGGPGCPVINEYAALDLALSLGRTTDAGLAYLAKALELRHRLPRLHARVVALEIGVWQAFRVAERTLALPLEGAEMVDRLIVPFLHRCSWAQVDRAVDAARVAFDPAEAERLRLLAAEDRHATLDLTGATTTGTTGTVELRGHLDLADALDLEHALRDGAQTLADLGSTESLDVRRSQAPARWPDTSRPSTSTPGNCPQVQGVA